MVPHTRQQKIDINSPLFKKSSRFSFIQAIRLLELYYSNKERTLEKKIRVRPRLSLDFPNSDIVSINKEQDVVNLTVTFMGLYGESSPLPTFYTEMLLQEERSDKSVMREFIDIFNNPIYQIYFKVWLKNQLGVRVNEFNDTKILNFLHLFSGMPQAHLREKHKGQYPLLKYAGLNMQYPRSAEALRTLVSDIINNNNIQIIQCIRRMVPIPNLQRCSLGVSNSAVGDTLHLGNKIKDRMGKFRIFIYELDMQKLNTLLPGTKSFVTLVNVVKLYIGESLNWDIQLTLHRDVKTDILLGAEDYSKLGLNTWLGTNKTARTLFLNPNQYKVD